MKSRQWWWALALLPLIGAPLIAQEPAAEDAGEGNQDQAPAPPAATPEEEEPEAARQQPDPPEERVSADNNLSFPVDI